ncbi:ABC transporter substrate-binding protein [Castellaniella sp.]|uniref:ABC transporter substrate-binding protein n=1 Tax=Castellaniella sp. TaxID=1955812 RepID=UPI003563C20D
MKHSLLGRFFKRRSLVNLPVLLAASVSFFFAQAPVAQAAAEATKIELFLAPNTDSTPLWAAYSQGFYKDAGLDVTIRTFPSGSTAFQAYRSGLGTLVMSGDLPSLLYWISSKQDYRAIMVLTRHTKGYVVQALKDITKAQDLEGKSVATRVGSSGSWLLSEFLAKNGVDESKVKVLNLDTNQMPIALCKGDIAAFFVWQPFGSQAQARCDDKVHQLADAKGYMRGYTVLGARPAWLKDNRDAAIAFVQATTRGAVWAEENPAELAAYLEANYGADAKFSENVLTFMDLTPLFDQQFHDDYTSLSAWHMKSAGADAEAVPIDFANFIWTDGVDTLTADKLPAVPAAAKD